MKLMDLIFQQFLKCRKVSTDTRNVGQGAIFFALKGANFDGNDFAHKAIESGASMVVADRPTLKGDNIIIVEDALKALQELARMYRHYLKIPFFGLTGTNGKTTTKELITAVLSEKFKVCSTKGNLNNHIGVPLTILSIAEDSEIAVIEMGANHPGDIEELTSIAFPDYGLITNVGKAHLEGFGSFEGVMKTKGELYDHLSSNAGTLFLNTGNGHLVKMAESRGFEKFISYGASAMNAEILPTDLDNPFLRLILTVGDGRYTFNSKLVGSYNADNVMAAVAVGLYFGVSVSQIVAAIQKYTPENNRSQLLRTANNLVVVDCYNANPTSMDAAITNFSQFNVERKVAILGDMLELGDASEEEHLKVVERAMSIPNSEIFLVGTEFVKAAGKSHLKTFVSSQELIGYLSENSVKDAMILVKGSRGIKLESCLPLL